METENLCLIGNGVRSTGSLHQLERMSDIIAEQVYSFSFSFFFHKTTIEIYEMHFEIG